jgi:L-arabinokinase
VKYFRPTWVPEEGAGVRAFFNIIEQAVPDYLAADRPVYVARAPGRLDVMGGIADYSGSLVLPMPLAEAAVAAVQERDDAELHAFSANSDPARSQHVFLRLPDLGLPDQPIEYAQARAAFAGSARDRWAAYVLGAVLVLARERGVRFEHGLALLLRSDVPEGKGVSSSAAIAVASMRAIADCTGVELADHDLARLCQVVENQVAGAPCGVMDQMAAVFGQQGKLLALRCQPCQIEGYVPVPEQIEVLGLDSGVRHAVSGSDYGSVRAGTFAGYRMLADLRGLPVRPAGDLVVIDDPEWRGHLANCPPGEFELRWRPQLPEQIGGAEFKSRYGGTSDPCTRIDPARSYAVRAPTEHAVLENARVERFRELLLESSGQEQLAELGDLMFASHASYSAVGLGNETTDWIVDQVRQGRSKHNGLWGARITGGGSGGTVAILGERPRAWLEALRIKRDLALRIGRPPELLRWSSDGAHAFDGLRLDPMG